MRKLVLAAALVGTMGLAACQKQSAETYRNQSGSVALSSDDALVYAIDRDNEVVAVVDAKTLEKVASVKVGAAPEQIAVGPDDTLYVTNRGARQRVGDSQGRVGGGGADPGRRGALRPGHSPDGKILYVVNSTSLESADYGTLTAVDTASLQVKWDLTFGEEPRSIALLGGDRAMISLQRKGDVVVVDLSQPEIVRDNSKEGRYGTGKGALYEAANESKVSGQGDPFGTPIGSVSTYRPRSAGVVVANPEGTHAFMPVTWSREDPIGAQPDVWWLLRRRRPMRDELRRHRGSGDLRPVRGAPGGRPHLLQHVRPGQAVPADDSVRAGRRRPTTPSRAPPRRWSTPRARGSSW